jgi:uncharacterized protein
MRRYALDANAIIIYFEGRNGAEKVQKILDSCANREAEIYMSVINVAEVLSVLWKKYGEANARRGVQLIVSSPISVLDASLPVSLDAAEIRAKVHTGLGDSFAAVTAISKRAVLVTADPEFRRFNDRFKVLWLPSHKSVN